MQLGDFSSCAAEYTKQNTYMLWLGPSDTRCQSFVPVCDTSQHMHADCKAQNTAVPHDATDELNFEDYSCWLISLTQATPISLPTPIGPLWKVAHLPCHLPSAGSMITPLFSTFFFFAVPLLHGFPACFFARRPQAVQTNNSLCFNSTRAQTMYLQCSLNWKYLLNS